MIIMQPGGPQVLAPLGGFAAEAGAAGYPATRAGDQVANELSKLFDANDDGPAAAAANSKL